MQMQLRTLWAPPSSNSTVSVKKPVGVLVFNVNFHTEFLTNSEHICRQATTRANYELHKSQSSLQNLPQPHQTLQWNRGIETGLKISKRDP